jgi:hypothetical protein
MLATGHCVTYALIGSEVRRIPIPRTRVNKGHEEISLDVQGEVVAVPGNVAGVAAGMVIRCRLILIVGPPFLFAHPDGRNAALNRLAAWSRRRPRCR